MEMPVRLIVYHRSCLFGQCLTMALQARHGWTVVEQSYAGTWEADQARDAHVALVDLRLPHGSSLDLVRRMRSTLPELKVVVLVPRDACDDIVAGVAAGAHACLLEESSLDELCEAIDSVQRGEAYCPRAAMPSLFRHLSRFDKHYFPKRPKETVALTERETEILALISSHLSNKQIAKRLRVSIYTVKNHVHNILEKLQVDSRFEAVEYARERSWFATK